MSSIPNRAMPHFVSALRLIAQDEAASTKKRDEGKYNERDKAAASSHVKAREDKPADVFLEPKSRKYPVKEKRNGKWVYDRDLLLGAAREARMHGHKDLADRADSIRKREFGGK